MAEEKKLRLFNTIIVYDVYTAAYDFEAANAAALELVRASEDPLVPSEAKALEVRREVEVREAWRGEKPIVGADVSDADFETLKGKTTIETFTMLHKKTEEKK